MSAGPIALLDQELYVADADHNEFERLVAEELGPHAGPEDQFDADLLGAASAAEAALSVVPALDGDLAEAEAAAPAFALDEETPVADELAQALANGDAVLGDFSSDFGAALGNPAPQPPAPSPPPTPPSGGGGGVVDRGVCDPWPCTL